MSIKLKNIIFDLGNVLFSWTPKKILADMIPSSKFSFERLPDNLVTIWREFDRGIISEDELIKNFASILEISLDLALKIRTELMLSLIPIQESVHLLEDLHEKGYKLYCLSNISSSFGMYLKNNNSFFDRFDGIIFSADVKAIKPDPEIYQILISKYQIIPNESVFIDDRIENVEGAKKIGFHSILFMSPKQLKSDLLQILTASR